MVGSWSRDLEADEKTMIAEMAKTESFTIMHENRYNLGQKLWDQHTYRIFAQIFLFTENKIIDHKCGTKQFLLKITEQSGLKKTY